MPSSQNELQQIVLDVNGFHFDALSMGPASGPLVLFLHGFPQFADSWIPVMRHIAQAGFHAVAVDQRGYSPGARPTDTAQYALPLLASDALGFADAFGATSFHLVGHDWGGFVAWQVAALAPDRVLSLTVLSVPHPNAYFDAMKSDVDQLRKAWYVPFFQRPVIAETALLAFHAKMLRAGYQGKLSPEAIESNVKRLSQHGALTAALNWYRAVGAAGPVGKISTPTLYLWGEDDPALGETPAINTANFVTGPYRFERLKGKTHWLIEEAEDQVTSLLSSHIRNAHG